MQICCFIGFNQLRKLCGGMQGALAPMNFGLEGLEHSCIGNVLQVAGIESIQRAVVSFSNICKMCLLQDYV